ncbi:MAG: polysaccharide biosynthesis/export family protein [Candidatus Omnitrophica bacterium]|nr:polysaccharide biosynthesis/export family protein [Candidatus Omnitrophota bacterium]
MVIKDRLSITDVAKAIGVTPRTIMRWEKSGKIKKSKRDWRGWRFYTKMDLEDIRKFYESTYEYGEYVGVFSNANNGVAANVAKSVAIVLLAAGSLFLSGVTHALFAATKDQGSVEVIEQTAAAVPSVQTGSNIITRSAPTKGISETPKSVDIVLSDLPVMTPAGGPMTAPVTYTLGPDDVISVDVRRHPEFSGKFTINSEGKIEYKYVGDVIIVGLTKDEVKERLSTILSEYIIEPDINVQIDAYLSKVFYVVGEVGRPGKFYMRGNTITVREALVQSGLPTYASAMRRCRLITPDKIGKDNYTEVDVYKLLYEGDLRQDLVMKPADVLYVPATVLAKIIRVIAPVKDTASDVASTAGMAAVAL